MQDYITIYDAAENPAETVTQVIDASLNDRLDGTLTLSFVSKFNRLPEITENTLIGFRGQYYRATQVQSSTAGNAFHVSVSCEQESISLVDMEIEQFDFAGSADDALARLLDGTGITATAEHTGTIAVSASGGNRRSVLLEIAKLCDGEIEYSGHHIYIRKRRGRTDPIDIVRACQCTDVTKAFDLRNGTESYELTGLNPEGYAVGDEVILDFAPLGINVRKRIIGISYNPFDCRNVSVEAGDYIIDITDDYASLEKLFLLKADAKIEFEKYINSAEGTAGLKAALSGAYVSADALNNYVKTSELSAEVKAYINGEEGQAMLTQSLSGKFVTVQEYGNNITLTATAQMFTKAAGNTNYTPSSITLTAQTDGTLTYTWYKNGTAISGQTGNTLSVTAGSITGSAATYKVVGKDTSGKTYSDQITIAKISDGVDGADGKDGSNGKDGENGKDGVDGANGKDGENGKDGKDGSDGYTTILSNEYIEIPVNFQRFPKTSGTYSCVVSVYRGTTKLSATKNSTLSDGEFKVSTPSGKNGITVSQVVAGTIAMSVSTASALSDITALEFNIDIYGGISLPAKIVVTANMNDVAAGAYTVTSNIGSYIDTYITENKGSITNALKGEFVTSDELGHYVKTTEVESKIEQEVSDGFAKLTLTAKESTLVENVPTDTLVGDYAEYIFTIAKAYSFKLQNGWYISQNAGDANSFSYGRIEFNFSVPTMVALEIVNYGETYYDYGMVGEIDAKLSESATEDTSGIMHSFRNVNAWDGVHTFIYEIPAGVHHIDVKYIKDGSQDADGDYFKIRAVAVETKSTSSGSTIELSSNGTVISSADIVFKGFVTFESLSTPGATTIDGGNIDTDNLHVENIYLGGDNSRKILYSSLMSNGAGQIHFGFMTTLASASYAHDVMIYAKKVWFIPPGGNYDSDGAICFDTSVRSVGGNKSWDWEGLYT